MNEVSTTNKMGTMPVAKLILNMSLPMMFSMLVLALYNIVDSMFVSRINEDALTAVSLAFPIQNLITSFGVGTGVGVNALLSRRLGEKNLEDVNKTAMNGVFLSLCTGAVFIVLGFFFISTYLYTQTDNSLIIEYGLQYLHVAVYSCPIILLSMMMEKILQSTGRTLYSMLSQMSGAIINIIFDPILIFGIGPFPEMGVMGAAIATMMGQFVSLCVGIFANLKKNPDVKLQLKYITPNGKIIAEIYKVGVPSILLSSITSVTTYFINLIIGAFSSTAIAVYGVYFKLNSFIFMPVFGLNSGVVPIVAYNFGAKDKDRIMKAIKYSLYMAAGIMFFGTLIFILLPGTLLKIFSASDSMMEIGIPAMRIISLSFIGAAISISFSSVFQALGKAFYSMLMSFIRQLIVLLPSAYLLSLSGNINLIWFCFPIAEVAAVGVSVGYMISIYNKMLKNL